MTTFLYRVDLIVAVAIVTLSCIAFFITKKGRQRRAVVVVTADELQSVAADTHQSSSSSTTNPCEFEYDVFISFRGEDTRKNFAGHLYRAFKQKGTRVFIDSEGLHKGENIGNLFSYIERSAIFVTIFSKRYAESAWCLKEITKIVQCERKIFPIFYNVEPADVRHQRGSFSKYFKKHQRREDVETVNDWKEALRKVSNISGYVLDKDYGGDEAKLIDDLVHSLLKEVYKLAPLQVAVYPVGLDSRFSRMQDLLKISEEGHDEVRFVGICGIGGLGKSTIAKDTFNKLRSNFEASSFIANVREKASKQDGLVQLQGSLISDLFGDDNPKIDDIDAGIKQIQARTKGKKILVVLDDVDHNDQLDNLIGDGSWLHIGSRLIITTRDESVLTGHGLLNDVIYYPEKLDKEQSLELFSHFAFRRGKPTDKYLQLAKEIIEVIGTLPLVLVVLGSHHFSKSKMEDWEQLLEKLRKLPDKNVQNILKLSYDSLEEHEKQIFLDIACLFLETILSVENAIYMWEACEFFPKLALRVLEQKSLLKRNSKDKFEMHDEIRDMAREIVRQEDPSKPWVRSRVWQAKEALQAMRLCDERSRNIEALIFHPKVEGALMTAESISAMSNIRMLIAEDHRVMQRHEIRYDFDRSTLEEEVKSDSKALVVHDKQLPQPKWLDWPSYPYESLPQGALCIEQIAVLELPHFQSEYLRLGSKEFPSLKVLNLEDSINLVLAPDFSLMPHLERLSLSFCDQLEEISPSIGQLKKLVELDLPYCRELGKLPDEVCQCTTLETLNLNGCENLAFLPMEIGNMRSLTKLHLRKSGIRELPSSINKLKSLKWLFLNECKEFKMLPEEITECTSLLDLYLGKCSSLSSLPKDIGNLTLLSILELSFTRIEELPSSISKMRSLICLVLEGCEVLKELPSTIGSLEQLQDLNLNRASVRELPSSIGQLKSLKRLWISSCSYLVVLPEEIRNCTSLRELRCDYCSNLSSLPRDLGSLRMLEILSLRGCKKLEKINLSCSNKDLESAKLDIGGGDESGATSTHVPPHPSFLMYLYIVGCSSLVDVIGLEEHTSLTRLDLDGCKNLTLAFMSRLHKAEFNKLEELKIPGMRPSSEQKQVFENADAVLQFTLPNINKDKRMVKTSTCMVATNSMALWSLLAMCSSTSNMMILMKMMFVLN